MAPSLAWLKITMQPLWSGAMPSSGPAHVPLKPLTIAPASFCGLSCCGLICSLSADPHLRDSLKLNLVGPWLHLRPHLRPARSANISRFELQNELRSSEKVWKCARFPLRRKLIYLFKPSA
eukprot:353578-Chlamydomonas_euryale.AAC.12